MRAIPLLALLCALPLPGATILNYGSTAQGIFGGQITTGGFRLTTTWNNVTIAAPFGANLANGGSAVVYLTTQIGPGTTIANEAASNATIPVPSGVSTANAFAGLTLVPGDYWFTIAGVEPQVGAVGGGTLSNTPAPGVTALGQNNLLSDPFAPAGVLVTAYFPAFRFTVTGDEVVPTPEPATATLIVPALLGLYYLRRRTASNNPNVPGSGTPVVL